MPVSTIANRRSETFDKALELRNYSAAAVSATGSEAAVAFVSAPTLEFKAVVNAAAHTGYSAGTAQWTISVEASVTGTGSWVSVGSVVLDGTQKEFDIPLSGDYVEQLVSGAKFLRATATKTGAPGNLTYGVYLARCASC